MRSSPILLITSQSHQVKAVDFGSGCKKLWGGNRNWFVFQSTEVLIFSILRQWLGPFLGESLSYPGSLPWAQKVRVIKLVCSSSVNLFNTGVSQLRTEQNKGEVIFLSHTLTNTRQTPSNGRPNPFPSPSPPPSEILVQKKKSSFQGRLLTLNARGWQPGQRGFAHAPWRDLEEHSQNEL